MSTVARFEVEYTRFLDPQGEAVQPLPPFALDAARLIPLYRAMYLTRVFDSKAIALQRTGKIGTFASALGQEAIGVGLASAMRAEDVLVPSYRDHGAQFWRGVTMTESLRYWGGDECGSDFAVPRSDFPIDPSRPVFPSIVSMNLSMRREVVGPAGPTTSSRTASTGPT